MVIQHVLKISGAGVGVFLAQMVDVLFHHGRLHGHCFIQCCNEHSTGGACLVM